MEKMKAVVYDKKGSPVKLVFCDVEKPLPNDNEVLVKVVAVSANAADYRGSYQRERSSEPMWLA
jgi:NADPH:quinone reductase-like Zn-dependent oxidoreductase